MTEVMWRFEQISPCEADVLRDFIFEMPFLLSSEPVISRKSRGLSVIFYVDAVSPLEIPDATALARAWRNYTKGDTTCPIKGCV